MSTTTGNWIFLSVFYNKTQWQKLIAGFLNPYITVRRNSGNFGLVHIAFNAEQGDNIRIAVEITSTPKTYYADDLHNKLNEYLIKNPSPEPAKNYLGKVFFMDFYNNSIQYNLYKLNTANASQNEFSSQISERILNVFSEDEYDESTMFAFALYIIITLCHVWQNTYQKDVFLKIKAMLYAGGKTAADLQTAFKAYHRLFVENSEMITGIYHEVLDACENDGPALNLWSLKTHYAQLLLKSNADLHFKDDGYLPFDKTVIDQLNINPKLLPAIYYVIYLCAESLRR